MGKENQGEIFRSIRESRGFSLKEAAGNTVTPQFLRKFENGMSKMTIQNFEAILENIGVDWEAYQFRKSIADSAEGEFFKWQTAVADLIHKKEYGRAMSLINQPLKDPEINDYFVLTYKAVVKIGIANTLGEHMLTQKDWQEIEYVKQRLMEIDQWDKIELNVFAQLMTQFDYDVVRERCYKVLHELQANQGLHHFSLGWHYVTLLAHAINYFSIKGSFEEAEKLAQELLTVLENNPQTGINIWSFLEVSIARVYNFLRHDKVEGLELAQKVLRTFRSLEQLGELVFFRVQGEAFFETVVRLNKTGQPFDI